MFRVCASVVLLFCTGCSYLGLSSEDLGISTTGAAAATGAVIGGGLGAIVGSESGHAGPGLAIGSLAGAAAGGLVGQELETRHEAIAIQQERIRRQREVLDSQRRELEELRRQSDTPQRLRAALSRPASPPVAILPRRAPRPQPEGRFQSRPYAQVMNEARGRLQPQDRSASQKRGAIEEDLVTPPPPLPPPAKTEPSLPPAKVAVNEENKLLSSVGEPAEPAPPAKPDVTEKVEQPVKAEAREAASVAAKSSGADSDCSKAEDEARRASSASEADQLFYLRRAIRLCPKAAQYHLEIGKVYATLGRVEDAEFEFRQALELDPQSAGAKEQLAKLAK